MSDDDGDGDSDNKAKPQREAAARAHLRKQTEAKVINENKSSFCQPHRSERCLTHCQPELVRLVTFAGADQPRSGIPFIEHLPIGYDFRPLRFR